MTNIIKDSDKEKYECSGYGVAFDGKCSWSLNNDSSRNITIFGVDNNSSSHIVNHKNYFLVLHGGPAFCINGSFGSPEKKFSINFSKAKTKFCLHFHYNSDNNNLFVNGKEIYKFKASNKNVNFPSQFCLRSTSNKFDYVDLEEVSLKFSVDYNAIDKYNILNIHKYLMIKISI